MSAYVVFDVDIRELSRYQDFMKQVKPALEAAGARYLARGGAHKVYEGDWTPRRIVILEFPSVAAWEQFYVQLIYVLKGWFKNEFEGEGVHIMREGSCWIQPPGIRHSVLGWSDDCELLEIILPAEHETVNDH